MLARDSPRPIVPATLRDYRAVLGESDTLSLSWLYSLTGGLGGFFLPFVLGAVRDATGSYAAGLLGCAALFLCGTMVLLELGTRWSQRWDSVAIQRTGLYSYRCALVEADDESVA